MACLGRECIYNEQRPIFCSRLPWAHFLPQLGLQSGFHLRSAAFMFCTKPSCIMLLFFGFWARRVRTGDAASPHLSTKLAESSRAQKLLVSTSRPPSSHQFSTCPMPVSRPYPVRVPPVFRRRPAHVPARVPPVSHPCPDRIPPVSWPCVCHNYTLTKFSGNQGLRK